METGARDRLRVHALDRALLLFRPSTGDAIRVDAPETRRFRRRAPFAVHAEPARPLAHATNRVKRELTVLRSRDER
jgi:hypothetical protein